MSKKMESKKLNKSAYFILVIFAVALYFIISGNDDKSEKQVKVESTQTQSNKKLDIDYKVVSDESLRNIKRSVTIVLNKRITAAELEAIAKKISSEDKQTYQRIFISYLLKGQSIGSYWATTNYNPDLKIIIIGSTLKEHKAALAIKPEVSGKVIGVWLNSWGGTDRKMIAYNSDGKVYIKTIFVSGRDDIKEYLTKDKDGEEVLEDINGNYFGEYYVINKKKELEFWNKERHFYTASPVA